MNAEYIKSQNPEKEYPVNMGKIWSKDEIQMLLQELKDNVDIETIAQIHKRTIGGIICRQREIAYNLYICHNSLMEEIINITKLNEEQILETIQKTEQKAIQKAEKEKEKNNSIKVLKDIKDEMYKDNEMKEMKNEMKEMKNEMKEMKNEMKEMKNEMKEMKNEMKEIIKILKTAYDIEYE